MMSRNGSGAGVEKGFGNWIEYGLLIWFCDEPNGSFETGSSC